MTNDIQLKINIDLANSTALLNLTKDNVDKLTGSVKRAADQSQGFGERMSGSLARIGFAFDGLRSISSAFESTFGGLIQSYQNQEAAQRKLAATAKLTGADYDNLKKTAADAVTAYALNVDQANNLTIALTKLGQKAGDVSNTSTAIGRLLDVAAAQGYDAGQALEAINQAILGLDEGTDKLFQKNPSVIYEEFAAKIGTTAGKLTDQQKAQALLNAVMTDGLKVQGEYGRFLDGSQGAASRFNAALEQSKAQLGEMIGVVLTPAVRALTSLVQAFNALPPETKEAAVAIGAMGAAVYVFSSVNIVGVVSSLASFVTSLTIVKGYAAGEFIVGIGSATAAITTMQLAMGGIIAVVAVLGVFMYTEIQKSHRLFEEQRAAELAQTKKYVDEMIAEYARLSKEKRNIKLNEMKGAADATRTLLFGAEQELKSIEKSQKPQKEGSINSPNNSTGLAATLKKEEIANLRRDLETQNQLIGKMRSLDAEDAKKTSAALTEQQKKDAEELSTFRIAQIKDEKTKELAELDAKYAKERTDHKANTALLAEINKAYAFEKQAIADKYAEKTAGQQDQHQRRLSVMNTDESKAFLDIEEKKALATAQTEAERLKIVKDYAIKRIEVERDAQLLLLDIELGAIKRMPDSPEKTGKVGKLADERAAVTSKATAGISAANDGFDIGAKKLSTDNQAENQKALEGINAVKDRYALMERVRAMSYKDLDKGIGDSKKSLAKLEIELLAAKDARSRESLLAQIAATNEHIGLFEAEKDARIEANSQMISSAMAQYDSAKSIGENLKSVIVGELEMYAAKAVVSSVSSALASVPFPFNMVLGAAAGIAAKGLMSELRKSLGLATGGMVHGPGGPREDKIPAMLSNGEFVVNAESTSRFLPILEQLNNPTSARGMKLPQFATGGFVGLDMPELKNGFQLPNVSYVAPRHADIGAGKSSGIDTRSLERKLDGVISAIANMQVIANIDGEKLTAKVESQQRKNLSRLF